MKVMMNIAPLLVMVFIFGCGLSKGPESTNREARADISSSLTGSAPVNKSTQGKHKVTFVELGSVNCIPCRMMQPVMKAIETEYGSQIKIVFHDVWTPRGKNDAAKYNIRVIPTQVFLDSEGKEYFRHEGFFPREEVVKIIKMKGIN